MSKKEITFRRHGDLNFFPISEAEYNSLQGEIVQQNKICLQKGETTGHKHVLIVDDITKMEVKKLPDGTWAMKVRNGLLIHEDHKKIELAPGYYRQIRERELDPFADSVERKVID